METWWLDHVNQSVCSSFRKSNLVQKVGHDRQRDTTLSVVGSFLFLRPVFFPPFSSLVYFFSRFDFYCIIKSWCNWTFLSPGVNDVNRRDILRWILIQGWNRWIRRSQRRWLVSFPFRPDVTKAYSLNACHKFVLRHARLLIVKMSSSSFILPVPRVCRDLMKTKISRWLCPKAKPLKKSAGWLFGVVLSPWV